MKKRILTLFVAVIMVAALCLPLTVSAEEAKAAKNAGMEVTVGSLSAKQGDEIVIPVTIDRNSGIWGFNWKIYYDSQVLRFDSVEFSKDGDFSKVDFLDTNEVKYPVVVQAYGNSVTENVAMTGVAAKIHFKVFVGAKLGETKVELRVDDPGNNIDVDANEVLLKANNGVVTVTEGLTSSDNPEDYPPKEPLQEIVQHPGHVGDNAQGGENGAGGNGDTEKEGGSKWIFIIIGVVVLIGVVVVIWLFSGSDDDDDDDGDNVPEKRKKDKKADVKEDDASTIPLDEVAEGAEDE